VRPRNVSGDLIRNDDDIMREAAESRPAAFAEIFERHHARVYGYLRKLTGTGDRALDLTQETFLLAFKSRESYEPRGLFQAWLYRIATNLARAQFQRAKLEPELMAGARLDARVRVAADAERPVDGIVAADTRQFVEEALRRLSPEEREVVVLRHFEDLKFREIAETLGISESTAKSRMRYGLDKLANILRPHRKELS
jgi:RNA polymerase sigma-70 factor (ECF subfamily)